MITATILFITALYLSSIFLSNFIARMITKQRIATDTELTILLIATCILWGLFYYFNQTN